MAAICVYCASSDNIDERYLTLAADVGTALVKAGHTLVSGGGSVGMMGALARAVRAAGGHTLGVIPQALLAWEVGDRDAHVLHVVDTMRQRKQLMEDSADAFLTLPGGLGTLEEMFEVWTSSALSMHPKPVVVLDIDGFYDPLWTFLDGALQRGFIRPAAMARLHRATSIEDALTALTPDPAAPPQEISRPG